MKKSFDGFKALALSAIAVKVLGFFYKLPLANVLEEEYLGIYQLVFPIYSLALTLTSSAFPSAIAGRVREDGAFVRYAKNTLFKLGFFGSVALLSLSFPLALIFGEKRVAPCFMLLSPSIYFVARIAFYRGVSQGFQNFAPTALSEISEQFVKLCVSLPLLFLIKDKYVALLSAIASITVAEGITLLFLKRKVLYVDILKSDEKSGEKIFSHVLSFSIFPVCAFVEATVFLRLFGNVSDYGLYSGVALVLCSIPATVVSSLSASVLPTVSSSENRKENIACSIETALFLSLPFVFGLFLYSKEAIALLFPRISSDGRELAVFLSKLCSPLPLFQGVQLVTTAILYGKREERKALASLLVGGGAKLAVFFAGALAEFGIKTAAIAINVQHLLAAAVNLVYIIRDEKLAFSFKRSLVFVAYCLLLFVGTAGAKMLFGGVTALFVSVVYASITLLAFLFSGNCKAFRENRRKRKNGC